LAITRIEVTVPVFPPFSQQARCQMLPRAWERTLDWLVRVSQKKSRDLLIVGCNVLDHDQQLLDER
jgi:hypothetical protein